MEGSQGSSNTKRHDISRNRGRSSERLGEKKARGDKLMSGEEKIRHLFESRKELIRELYHKAETMKQIWAKEKPRFSAIAQIYEFFLREIENHYEMHEVLFGSMFQSRKEMNNIHEWIKYLKGEIDYLKTITPSVPRKLSEAEKTVKALEKKQQDWEREYKPVLEHVKKWLDGEEKRQKRLKQSAEMMIE